MCWKAKATPRPLYFREWARVPTVEEAGWPSGLDGYEDEDISCSYAGIDTRTFQPVASRLVVVNF
jgi:hypothetical protein